MSRTNNHEGTIDPRPREGQSAAGGPRSALGCEVPPTPLARRPVPDELHGVVTATRSPPASRQHPTTTTGASYTRLVRRPARPVFPNTSDFNLDLLVKVMSARSLSVLSKYPVGAGLELQTSCFPPHPHPWVGAYPWLPPAAFPPGVGQTAVSARIPCSAVRVRGLRSGLGTSGVHSAHRRPTTWSPILDQRQTTPWLSLESQPREMALCPRSPLLILGLLPFSFFLFGARLQALSLD